MEGFWKILDIIKLICAIVFIFCFIGGCGIIKWKVYHHMYPQATKTDFIIQGILAR